MIYSPKKLMTLTLLLMAAASPLQGFHEGAPNVQSNDSSCWGRFFLSAEALYLRAFESNLSCVCDEIVITDTIIDDFDISTLTGKTHDPNFEWNIGCRAGFGYVFPSGCTSIESYWTHLDSKASKRNDENRLKWTVHFDAADLLISNKYFLSNCITLIPFGGVRYAKIDQKLNANFVSIDDENPIQSNRHLKEKFSGCGPLIGLEADRQIWPGFSLYGNLSLAVLYGTFNVKSHVTDTFITGVNIDDTKKHVQAYQPALDAGFGFIWNICFCNGCRLSFQLGAELHRYFHQNQFHDYGDLCLDGASAGIGFEF